LGACLLGVAAAAAQERRLPEQESFLRDTAARLQTDSSLQRSYIYVETRREQKLDEQGQVNEESVKVYESYPGLPGEDRWERLITRNGQPRPAAELEKEDRDRLKKAEAFAGRLAGQAAQEKAREERELTKRRREFQAVVDDIFTVFDIRMQGREVIDGRDTIALVLSPRPGAKPRTEEGSQMRKFAARAWISESDDEVVRVDAEAIDNLSAGFGPMTRLQKGAQLSFLRRKVNDEVWLPARVSYGMRMRVGLLWTIRRTGTSEFSDYRKFSAAASTTYHTPRP